MENIGALLRIMIIPELKQLRGFIYEIGPIRPPSEGGGHSLLIRATRNCPWNQCTFCYGTFYNREHFQLRTIEEIKKDIDVVKAISRIIDTITLKLGGLDWTARLINSYSLFHKNYSELNQTEFKNFQSITNVFNWLRSGAQNVFLQDANSLIMPTPDLIEVLKYLKQTFHNLKNITSYARAKTLAEKTKNIEELKELQKSGLSRLYVGLETGDDELLTYIKKGINSKEHVKAGQKAKEAGFELSEYWMPGLGGKKMSKQHAINTANVLNKINPDFVRSRRFVPRKTTPLYKEWKNGVFKLLSPHEELKEIHLMIENLEINGRICFDHFTNPAYESGSGYIWLFNQKYDGYKFPEEKQKVLEITKKGLEVNESLYMRVEDIIKMPL